MEIDVFTWIDTDENIDKVIASSIAFLKYKESGLKAKSPASEVKKFQTRTITLEKFLNSRPVGVTIAPFTDGCIETAKNAAKLEVGETQAELIEKQARFRKSVEVLSARVKFLCDTLKQENGIKILRTEFRTKIKNAILNLRKRVSGVKGSVAKTRGQIERILYDFANSWESFKDSYNLNMVLLGGAGVGKTTLANAFAECLYAYGINSSDVISKPEKPDLIGQYLGQTAPLVYKVLYGSLEGVCFIDEAYSISGAPGGLGADYGQEFIDALVEFTQKFPGYLCLIVAGYKKEMKANFFARNEGLYRRFPTVFELLPYPIEDLRKAYINQIITKRELKLGDQAIYNTVDKALTFHSMLLQLLYLDTSALDDDDYYSMNFGGEPYNFIDKYNFNLSPIISLLYLSPDENKRNILKAYIMRYVFAIKEGDFFPNQMGDIQNYVDKTLKQENVFFGNTITMDDAQKTMNAYFSIRANHKLYLLDRGSGIPSIEFATHGQSPDDFAKSVLLPFLKPIVTYQGSILNLNDPIQDNGALQHLETVVGELYTKAVTEIYSDFNSDDNEKRPPSFVQYEFLKFEAETLERINKDRVESGEVGRTRLKYFETMASLEEESDLSMSAGAMPIQVKKSPSQECGALARQESGAHKDGLVAAAGSSPAEVTNTKAPDAKRIVFKKVIEGDTLYYADPEGIKWAFYRDEKGVFILRGPLPSNPQPIRHPNIVAVFGDNLLTLPMKELGKPKTVIYTYNEKRLYLSYSAHELLDPSVVHVRDGISDKSPFRVLYLDAAAAAAAAPMAAAAAAAPDAIPKLSARSLSHPFYNYEIKEGEKILKATLILDNTKLFFVFEDKSIMLPKFIDVEIDLQSRHKILRFEKDEKGDYKSLSDFESTPLEGLADPGEIYASLGGKTVKVEEQAAAAPAPAPAPVQANAPPPTARVGLLWTAQQTDVPSEFNINGAKWRLEISPRDILTITPVGILRGLPTELSIAFESPEPGFENQGRWLNFKKEKAGNIYRAVQVFGSTLATDTSDKTQMYALSTASKVAAWAGAELRYKIIHLYQRGGRRNFVFTRKLKRN